MKWKTFPILVFVVLIGACGSTRTRHGVGRFCLAEEQGPLVTGETVTFSVGPPECWSSGCESIETAQCTVELEDDVLHVDARWELEPAPGRNQDCSGDCQTTLVSCSTPPLAAGDYVVRLPEGTDFVLSVPGDGFECDENWTFSPQ